jgi:NAD(P)-dependent dehydrogenase (short-subunit alcohol dehydrogenase family)
MNGKVALITGARSGIGRATAELFAERGAKVVVAARREYELAALAAKIEEDGIEASYIVTDVSHVTDVERMVDHAIETFGRLDYAVNNAGIDGEFPSIAEMSEEQWDRVLDINLKGTFLCLKHEARAMLAGGARRSDRQRRLGELVPWFCRRRCLRRVQARTGGPDHQRIGRTGAARDPGQYRLPGSH